MSLIELNLGVFARTLVIPQNYDKNVQALHTVKWYTSRRVYVQVAINITRVNTERTRKKKKKTWRSLINASKCI